MKMEENRVNTLLTITGLIYKARWQELSEEESLLLEQWKLESSTNGLLFTKIQEEAFVQSSIESFEQTDTNAGINRVFTALKLGESAKPIPMHTTIKSYAGWLKYAAIILLVIGAGFYYFLTNNSNPENRMVAGQTDIQPGREGAVLTLADGSQVVLDSLSEGRIAAQNGASIEVQEGQLVYLPAQHKVGQDAYNTVTTNNGRQYGLTLPDGSKVWLNAASTIRYPTVFNGKERQVEVTGEAYFEIAKNANQPFFVKINNRSMVEVLGTSFNINAYENEPRMLTTLVEGRVRVRNGTKSGEAISTSNNSVILQPGQQAQLTNGLATPTNKSTQVEVINNLDIDKVIAWKNGIFDFRGALLEEVMRQLERWYDIEVVYARDIPNIQFGGKIRRDASLGDVLDGLKGTGVNFKIETGRKVIVMP